MGLRPLSPDDMPIIGPMRSFPNVILNVGYGPHGFRALPGGIILKSLVDGTDESSSIFD